MQVAGNRLHLNGGPVPYYASPNCGPALGSPIAIVLHYTGGETLKGAVNWLTDARSKASAHLVVDDIEPVQLVPFDQRAWHAGESFFSEPQDHGTLFRGLNQCSIGIEMVNPGRLTARADGCYYTRSGTKVPHENVVFGQALHSGVGRVDAWHAYPIEQVGIVLSVCQALIEAFPTIKYALGHDEIAIPHGRKVDPGPAFDMEGFRSQLFGRQ